MVDFFISLKSISTGDRCVLNFKPYSMFGKELHRVEGHIQDRRYEHVCKRCCQQREAVIHCL